MTSEERDEIKTALILLNHNSSTSREEYIRHISRNSLALKVKLNDLSNNVDISRIPEPTEKDYARLERYQKEHKTLLEALHNSINDK